MVKKRLYLLTISILVFTSCTSKLTDPQHIVDQAILTAGGEKFHHSTIEFDFRDRHYVVRRDGGKYSYERIFQDSIGMVHDFVTNDGFKREINKQVTNVPDTMAAKYTSSVNSVTYFALLPYRLNDAAVYKKLVGETTLKNKKYYKIQVTFSPDGGGEDHEDVFLYWVNQESFTVDYLAYSFEEDDETSFRFRVAINPRIVNGIRFQDYINYKPKDNSLKLTEAEELFNKGELIELSRIETEQPTVN